MKLGFIILLVCFTISISAQSKEQELLLYYKLIEKKLEEDQTYLSVKSLSINTQDIKAKISENVPRYYNSNPLVFNEKDGYTYYFLYLDETIDIDSIVLIGIVEEIAPSVSTEGAGIFAAAAAPTDPIRETVFKFRDIHSLMKTNPDIYKNLVELISDQLQSDPLLEPRELNNIAEKSKLQKSKGISSKDNADFLNYNYVNGRHHYPEIKKETSNRRGRGRGSASASSGTDYKIDASLSHVTFFSKEIDFGFSGVAAEINFDEYLLNMLPWQPMTMSIGLRGLIALSGDKEDMMKDYILDLRILGRARLDLSSVVTSLPWIFLDKPGLNVGSGIVFDLKTTRAYGLPFINLYFSGGSNDVTTPYTTFLENGVETAYFSFNQWETSFSFFWNTSEKAKFRFKSDLGLAGFNVVKATYGTSPSEEKDYTAFSPIFRLEGTFVPSEGNELFGAKIRLFDSVIKGGFWLKVLTLDDVHTFRFETTFILQPMFRPRKIWEPEGPSMFQIRYRYGF